MTSKLIEKLRDIADHAHSRDVRIIMRPVGIILECHQVMEDGIRVLTKQHLISWEELEAMNPGIIEMVIDEFYLEAARVPVQ